MDEFIFLLEIVGVGGGGGNPKHIFIEIVIAVLLPSAVSIYV